MNKIFTQFVFNSLLVFTSLKICATPIVSIKETNYINGAKIYTTTYPFKIQKGLIRISNEIDWKKDCDLYPYKLYPQDCRDTSLTVARHAFNTVVIKAILSKAIVELIDQSEDISLRKPWHANHTLDNFDNYFKEYGYIWLPWRDDTIKKSFIFKSQRDDLLRGDNRLHLILNEPGHYYITIPYDADIEVTFLEGNINYDTSPSKAPTKLHIESTTVNRGGYSGMSTPGSNIWDYDGWYWERDSFAPITNLVTHKGHINVPSISS